VFLHKILLTLSIAFNYSNIAHSQSILTQRIDSLKNLKSSPFAYFELSDIYTEINLDSAIHYYQIFEKEWIPVEKGPILTIINSGLLKAKINYLNEDFDTSYDAISKCLDHFEKFNKNNDLLRVKILCTLTKHYLKKNKLDSAWIYIT